MPPLKSNDRLEWRKALARFNGGQGEIKSQVHPSRDVNGDENGKDHISFGSAFASAAARPEGIGGGKNTPVHRCALRASGYADASSWSGPEAGKRKIIIEEAAGAQ